MFVIKFSDGRYWTGYNGTDTQLRRAIVYNSLKMAISTAEDCLKRKHCFSNQPDLTYDIVEIEMREKEIAFSQAKAFTK